MTRPLGTCRLCLRSDVALCESHIVPKWAYRHLRSSEPGANPNPVDIKDGKAVQTSKQLTEYLLCEPCEQRLGEYDKYAKTVAYQPDGSAPLFRHVRRLDTRPRGEFSSAEPTSLDTDRLMRFGVSVVWRGHVARQLPACNLGDRYGEELRRFLLDERAFPENVACIAVFIEGWSPHERCPIDLAFCTPVSSRNDGYHTHRVIICGLHFEVVVGGKIPDLYRRYCVVRGNPRVVLLSTPDIAVDWMAEKVLGAKLVASLPAPRRKVRMPAAVG